MKTNALHWGMRVTGPGNLFRNTTTWRDYFILMNEFPDWTNLSPCSCWRLYWWVKLWQIPSNFSHVPLEAFAVQITPKFPLSNYIPCREMPVFGSPLIYVLCIFIHPNFSYTLQVLYRIPIFMQEINEKKVDS